MDQTVGHVQSYCLESLCTRSIVWSLDISPLRPFSCMTALQSQYNYYHILSVKSDLAIYQYGNSQAR